jgi:hypothetical protein
MSPISFSSTVPFCDQLKAAGAAYLLRPGASIPGPYGGSGKLAGWCGEAVSRARQRFDEPLANPPNPQGGSQLFDGGVQAGIKIHVGTRGCHFTTANNSRRIRQIARHAGFTAVLLI